MICLKKTAFALTALASSLFIERLCFGEEVPVFYTPVRAVGMGNASTAISNDENSIWTNPAGIARIRKARSRKTNNLTSFPGIVIGANTESRNFYEVYKQQSDESVEDIITGNEDLGEKPFWARASVFPITMIEMGRGLPTAFGLYANNKASLIITKDEAEVMRTQVISDVGAAIGFALTNNSNRFNIGFTLRPNYRYAYEDKIPTELLLDKKELPDRIKKGANKSFGMGVDVGMMYTFPDFWFPTFGLSIFNLPTGCQEGYLNPFSEKRQTVCGTKYNGDIGNEEALSVIDPMDIRAGVSIMPRLSRKIAFRMGLDVHNLYATDGENYYGLSDIEVSKLIHVGTELVFGNPLELNDFSLRVGLNQGFYTAGVTLRMPFLALEVSTYGVDVSSSSSPIEDRRILVALSSQF